MKLKMTKENVFYIAWILMEIHICIANSSAAKFSLPMISYICILLFLIKIAWTKKYTLKEIVIMLLLLLGGFLGAKNSADMRVLWFALAICAAKGINFQKVVQYSFRTMLACCCTFILMYIVGITEGAYSISNRGVRLGFGLGHPNMCSAYYCLLMIHIIYLYFDKIKMLQCLLFMLGEGVIYYFTKSNTGLIVALSTILIVIIIKYLPARRFNAKIITTILAIGIAVFTMLPIIYNDSFGTIDRLMTGRIHQAHFYYSKYGISLFGNDISYDLSKWNTDNILDFGYAKMIINDGVFYYAIVVGAYLYCMMQAIKAKKRELITLFASMIVYMYTENVATYIFMNVSMLAFSTLIFKGNIYSISTMYLGRSTLNESK